MIYFVLCADFCISMLASFFFAFGSGGKTVDVMVGAILGVSATVALAGIAIIHAIDQLPRQAKPSGVPSEI